MGRYSKFYRIESIIFYIVVIYLYYSGFKRGYGFSNEFRRENPTGEFIFGSPYYRFFKFAQQFQYDASDGQWRVFRNFIISVATNMFFYCLASRFFRLFGHWVHAIFHFIAAIFFVREFHRVYASPLLFFAVFNYVMTKYVLRGNSRLTVVYVWVFAISSLYFVDTVGREVMDNILFRDIPKYTNILNKLLIGRITLLHWVVMFDLNLLRMISFTLDYYNYKQLKKEKKKNENNNKNNKKERRYYCDINRRTFTNDILELKDYNFIHYINFMFYPPLYTSGPIMTFNCFVSYYYNPKFHSLLELFKYFLRWLLSFSIVDISLHFIFIFVMNKNQHFFHRFSAFDWICVAIWTLRIIWLKYNTIWKFFRFFAMIDGFVPHEDILGCWWNWKNVQTLWKEFHASIRIWTFKYIYLPLGGGQKGLIRKGINIMIVFIFIAFWHDVEWRLMIWAAIATIAFIPDLLITAFEKSQLEVGLEVDEIWNGWYLGLFKTTYLFVFSVFMSTGLLMGFGLGYDGTLGLWKSMFTTTEGWIAMGLWWYVFRFGYPLVLQLQKFQKEKENIRRLKIDRMYDEKENEEKKETKIN